jgi:hypothetical protein
MFGVFAEFAPYSYRGGGTIDTKETKWTEGAEEKVEMGQMCFQKLAFRKHPIPAFACAQSHLIDAAATNEIKGLASWHEWGQCSGCS